MLESPKVAPEKPNGLREKAKAEVFRRIQAAADELFSERDYLEVTTKEIAKRAGIGEATLFRYVESKSDLLAMVYGKQLQQLVDNIETADQANDELPITAQLVRDRILKFYEGRSQFYLLHPENAARYLRQSYDLASDGRVHAMEQGDRLIRRVTRILEDAQRVGVVSPIVNASVVALNCHGVFLHEVNRTSTRGFDPQTIWDRVSTRIDSQLLPLMPDLVQALQREGREVANDTSVFF